MRERAYVYEASYASKLGLREMMMFCKVADDNERGTMRRLIGDGDFKGAWRLLKKALGSKSRVSHLGGLGEAAYAGNLGFEEMVRFYRIASDKEISTMERLLKNDKLREAWDFLKKITGIGLVDLQSKDTRRKGDAGLFA